MVDFLFVHVVCTKVQVKEPKRIGIAGKIRMLGKFLRYDMLIARPKKVYAIFKENRQLSLSLFLFLCFFFFFFFSLFLSFSLSFFFQHQNMNSIVVSSCVQTVDIPRIDNSSY